MGEIADALRRARKSRGSGRSADDPQESTAARAGFEAPPPSPIPAPALASAGVPLRFDSDLDLEIVALSRDRDSTWPARAVLLEPRQPYTERIRRFAVRVREQLEQRDPRTILVTSACRSEGKTFTSCNLVLALASMPVAGRIALVELDLRRPAAAAALGIGYHAENEAPIAGNASIAAVPGISSRVGIETVIAGDESIDAAKILTELPSLDLYLVREPQPEAHRLLAHPRLAQTLRDLGRRYDAVVVDCPPVLAVPDVSLLLGHVGGCVAVVRAGSSRVRSTHDMFEQLPQSKLIGVFANDVHVPRGREKSYYYAAEDDPR
jgi:Mrp family chromosome partitioning ATPase